MTMSAIATSQASPVSKCTSLTKPRRPTSELRRGKYNTSPEPSSTKNAAACTQCRVRSVRENRWMSRGALVKSAGSRVTGSEAIRLADVCIDVVAALLPVAGIDVVGDDDLRDPLHILVAVHLRDHDANRCAVVARERLAVHLVGEHRVVELG